MRELSLHRISELDPLEFDSKAVLLPALNQNRDVVSLGNLLDELLSTADSIGIDVMDSNTATAAIRDIDFVCSSLIRHRSFDMHQQNAETTLASLSERSDTVPRGTVSTYAGANPAGLRQRSFTNTPEEDSFISSVRNSIFALDETTWRMIEVGTDESTYSEANEHLARMVDFIMGVRKSVPPKFFTNVMRPYFEPIEVEGVSYAGPGGAQMQVVGVDHMIWGADTNSQIYLEYFDDNRRYLTPTQKEVISTFKLEHGNKSILTLAEEGQLSSTEIESTQKMLKSLRRFRYPHLKIARESFASRDQGAIGSGKYTPEILEVLIDFNEIALNRIGDLVDPIHQKGIGIV